MNGKLSETAAAVYLFLNGYKILDRNFHSRFGEIDIVAKKKNTLVFVEVKARGENSLAQPSYAVDVRKQRKIIKTAQYYICNRNPIEADIRFDVVEIFKKSGTVKLNHIINAFGE